MHPNYKKLKMSSNKEMTLNGDIDTMILLKIDLYFNKTQLEELFGKLFDKDKALMLSLLEDDYLKLLQVKEQQSQVRKPFEYQPGENWDERRNTD